ncbi:hypothetical protein V8F20_001098 [Naviculisporaceae sp. PSN 640]
MAFRSGSYMRYIIPVWLLLTIDSAINLALTSSMVAFLHHGGKGPYEVAYPAGSTFPLSGHPANLLTNQGHTTNGANGTGLVLVGFGGALALYLQHQASKKYGKSSPFFYFWALITFLSWLLTLVALIFTFVVTNKTAHQSINLPVARANAAPGLYPLNEWTPENWYSAVSDLSLVNAADRHLIRQKLRLMRGWRYNLIPMFVLGLILWPLVLLELLRARRERNRDGTYAYGTDPALDRKPADVQVNSIS